MAEVQPRDILLRIGRGAMARGNVWVLGSARGRVEELKESFARASAQSDTYLDRDTIVRNAGANIIRPEYPPGLVDAAGKPTGGIRIDGARTNKIAATENLSTWNTITASVPTTNNPSPRGGDLTASFMREDATPGVQHSIFKAFAAAANGDRTGVLLFFKANGRTRARVSTSNASDSSSGFEADINLGTGVITSSAHGTGSIIVARMQALTGLNAGWFVVELYGITSTAHSALIIQLQLQDAAGLTVYNGDGVSGMLVWGVVVTDGTPASSYGGPAGVSAADALTAPISFGPMDLTVVATVARPAHADAVGVIGLHFGIMKISTSLELYFASGPRQIQSQVRGVGNSGAAKAIPAGATITAVAQYTGFPSAAKTRLDVGDGTGFGAFGATQAIAAFPNQILTAGHSEEGGSERLSAVLLDLLVLRGLFSYAEGVAAL